MGLVAIIRSWMVVILLLLLLLEWGNQCHGCWEQERTALLQIKPFFNDDYTVSGWGINANCCTWARVTCDATTKRVTELDLSFSRDSGSGGWYLNASLFLSFKDLTLLDLTGNKILGCIENEDFQKLSRLAHLETLNLGNNEFNKSILSSLRDLSSMKSLDLSDNSLKGIIDIQELHALSRLEELYLTGNGITRFVGTRDNKSESNCSVLRLGGIRGDANFALKLQSLHRFFPKLKSLGLTSYNLQGTTFGSYHLNNLKEIYLVDSTVDDNFLQSIGKLVSLQNLSITSLNSSQFTQGWPYLKNLKRLYISQSTISINHKMLQTIENLILLEDLSMIDCQLSGPIPKGLCELNQLITLDIRDNNLNVTLPPCMAKITSLQQLYLSNNQFSGPILEGLCELNQLITLDIQGNNLNGTLPPCMANLTSLRQLDLSYNNLSGTLPLFMANLTSLRLLDLFHNQFTGNISLSPLRTLTSIEDLYLSYNQFQVPVTLSPFFNHTKLHFLSVKGNNIFGETEQHSSMPKFQLTSLDLSGYGYGGTFPKFLYYQHNLESVDLSHIQLSGGFPYWLLENNTDLSQLYLLNNSLSGQLRLPSHSHTSLRYLDISENCLRGHVPAVIGAHLPNLVYLNVSGNGFIGRIPPSLGNMSSMKYLDLSNNGLLGEVPVQLAIGCFMLRMLVLSNNSLQGQIFPRNFNLHYLLLLNLHGNQFTGTIPNSLSNSSSLSILDLSHNNIHGRLPQWIGNMSALQVLDLSHNDISGSLSSNFPSSIQEVYLSQNRLEGPLENAFYNSSNLVMLDLGRNHFTGSIPVWIDSFSNLGYLLLDNNYFEGEIPMPLCRLDKLRLMDFSHNHLSGHILPCLRCGSTWDVILTPQSYGINLSFFGDSRFQPYAEFTTKSSSYSYQGGPLSYMSGIDLSCNNLMGEIPPELGNLSTIKVLNLSHNRLIGPIPSTFSNLKEIESLDLSYNNLDGKIPPQLTQLYELAVFNVTHNNLSGKTPERVAQFATFDNESYEDNPFLCGPPLTRSCNAHPLPPKSSNNSGKHEEETGLISMDAFYPSFLASYSVVLLGIAAVLYINPYWRRAWFYFVDECINNCYYFIVDNLPMLSKYRACQPCV